MAPRAFATPHPGEGRSVAVELGQIIEREGPLERDRALRLLSQIADALIAAHAEGRVHGGVSPSTILVAGETATLGDAAGATDFAAPERPLTPRSDVYSLASVLHYALTGVAPGTQPVGGAGAQRTALDSVIDHARENDPERRFRGPGEFMRAVLAVATRSPSAVRTVVRPRIAPPAPPEEREEPPPRRWAAWALGGLLVAALLVVAVLRLSSDSGPEKKPAPAPTPTPTASPSPSPSPTPTPTPSPSPADEVEQAVTRHWALIEQGRYADAYDALAPQMQARIPRAAWIRAQRQDRLTDVSISARAEQGPSPTTARAVIESMRTTAGSGCFTWTGAYELQRVGGVWRIAGSKLTRSAC